MRLPPERRIAAPDGDWERLRPAADALRAGGLVAFPTETVYGLGASALDAAAVARIFAAKGRPSTNPLIVHVCDPDMLDRLVERVPERARRLAARFWPGPLTLVLPRAAGVPDLVTAGGPTVGVRIPAHPAALAFIRLAGVPVAAPSANRSLALSPTTADHVEAGLGDRVDWLIDGGPCAAGVESTVIDLCEQPARLLRPGPVPPAEIEAILGATLARGPAGGIARSPGQMAKHYSPRTPLLLCDSEAAADAEATGRRAGRLRRGPGADVPGVPTLELPADPAGFSRELYAALHALDALGLGTIVAALPPAGDDWLAARDRLTRAAASG